MAIGLIAYLIHVTVDSAEHELWATDRDAAIRASDLSEENKELLLRNNRAEIERAIHKEQPEAQVMWGRHNPRHYVTVSFITVSNGDQTDVE